MAEATAKMPKEYSSDPEAVRRRLKRKREDPDFQLLLAQEHKCTKCPGLLHELIAARREHVDVLTEDRKLQKQALKWFQENDELRKKAIKDWEERGGELDEWSATFGRFGKKLKDTTRQLLETAAAKKLLELEVQDLKERITNGVSSGAIMCGNCKLAKANPFGYTLEELMAKTRKSPRGRVKGSYKEPVTL